MPISLDEPRAAGLPVVKRTAIGQRFTGMLVKIEERDVLKTENGVSVPVVNPRTGRNRREKVLTCMTLAGTTAPAGLGDHVAVPEVGDLVRVILRGKGFADWIEFANANAPQVGDVVEQITTTAQAYDANGNAKGGEMATQAEVDALPRSTTIGIYGPLTVRRATAGEADLVERAEAHYMALKDGIALGEPAGGGRPAYADEEPFVADAADWMPGLWGEYPKRMLP